MRRLANGTQAASLPAPSAPVGTPGYGTNGDPAAGIQGSVFDADAYNPLQEEIVRVIEAAGLVPDGTLNQLFQAIRILAAHRIVTYSNPGTYSWTVPAGVYRARGRVRAGGGGGGAALASSGNVAAASGGGGGGYVEDWFDVTPGQVISIIVGAGGLAGTVSGTTPITGGSGLTSSVGNYLTATGGAPGVSVYNAIAGLGPAGGGGFSASGLGFVRNGVNGSGPIPYGASVWTGGPGGASFGTAMSQPGGENGIAPAGISAGAGGSGAAGRSGGNTGGVGAPGDVILEY